MTFWTRVMAFVVVATVMAGCGGSSSTPTAPTPPTTTTPPPTTTTPPTTPAGPNPTTATITIGADGRVTPTTVTIAPGGRVTFVNNHNTAHDMSSDPHPEHNECPAINDAGFTSPGQSRTTGNLNTVRTCRFHDHIDFNNNNLRGTIIIQ